MAMYFQILVFDFSALDLKLISSGQMDISTFDIPGQFLFFELSLLVGISHIPPKKLPQTVMLLLFSLTKISFSLSNCLIWLPFPQNWSGRLSFGGKVNFFWGGVGWGGDGVRVCLVRVGGWYRGK